MTDEAFETVRGWIYTRPAANDRGDVPAPTAKEALIAWFCCFTQEEQFAVFIGSHGGRCGSPSNSVHRSRFTEYSQHQSGGTLRFGSNVCV